METIILAFTWRSIHYMGVIIGHERSSNVTCDGVQMNHHGIISKDVYQSSQGPVLLLSSVLLLAAGLLSNVALPKFWLLTTLEA